MQTTTHSFSKAAWLNCVPLFFSCLVLSFVFAASVHAGPYQDSTHGDTDAGVSRVDLASKGYAGGNCAHCHEQHTSIDGIEPAPVTGAEEFLLFDTPNTNQTSNFCFDCHGSGATLQTGGNVVNRSYSYRAGGYTSDTVDDVAEAFSLASNHNLADIVTEASGLGWGYIVGSNACSVCHNPHSVQGDPEGSPNGTKTPSSRGWLTTLVSENRNSDPPNLWGDAVGERLSDYTSNYQAPYRFGSTTTYEPDGSSTQDGSNLADYNTFCMDCHNTTNTIWSSNLNRNLRAIDWENEKHGKGNADQYISVKNPYNEGSGSLGYVLSCLDCHEPHGSPNLYLLRAEVNGAVLSGTVSTGYQYGRFCERCHLTSGGQDWQDIHHSDNDDPYRYMMCGGCHPGSTNPQDCGRCHFHGSQTGSDGIQNATNTPASRRTF